MAPVATTPASRTAWDRLGTPLRALVWVLLVAGVLAIFREAETFVSHVFSVALLFVFASIVAVVLTPVLDLAERTRPFRSHRGPAALLLYAIFLALLVGVGFLVGPTLIAQGRQLPELGTHLQTQLNQWGVPVNIAAVFNSFKGFSLTSQLGLVTGVVGSIVSVVLVIVISIYLLIEGRAVIATLRKLFPGHTRLFDFMALAVGSTAEAYVRGQVIMSLLIGVYTTAAMALLGVHYAIVLGVAAAVLELVPMVGAVIAMTLAVVVALLQSPQLGIEAAAVGLLGHALEAYVVGPRISGRVTRLHPLVAMAALLVGADVGGILGALFGVPIAAIANIVLGAAYRSQQGEAPLTTHARGKISEDSLPRLGDEIGGIDRDGIVSDPVPREKGT
ncbi:MAG TPA: AI-2E family transporter [Candidatus Saccharimonadales bacterium]|nr:AI-2E family transporter [Candidatus Saccharimonadales bacterium]